MLFILVSKEKHISLLTIKIREVLIVKNINLLLPVPLALENQNTLQLTNKFHPGLHLFKEVGITPSKEKPTKEASASRYPKPTKIIEEKCFAFHISRKSWNRRCRSVKDFRS